MQLSKEILRWNNLRIIQNTTNIPTEEIRELLIKVSKGINISRIKLKIQNSNTIRYTGRIWRRRDMKCIDWKKYVYDVKIRIPTDQIPMYSFRLKKGERIVPRSVSEPKKLNLLALIWIHEIYHRRIYDSGKLNNHSEFKCERFAYKKAVQHKLIKMEELN